MESGLAEPIRVFYSYADRDEFLRNELEKHLIILSRQKLITSWHHRKITAGKERKYAIDAHIKSAQLILLLVSPDFLASDYCYEIEMTLALARHGVGDAIVIPILLRPVHWVGAPFALLQALPGNGKPITSWAGRNGRDKAFLEVALGIRTAIGAIQGRASVMGRADSTNRTPKTTGSLFQASMLASFHLHRAEMLYGKERYQEAVAIYEEALRLDPTEVMSWIGKGDALSKLERYQEAVISYEEALRLDPTEVMSWIGKGDALSKLERYQEAVISYEEALRLDPTEVMSWISKSVALSKLERYQEAVICCEKALRLDPTEVMSTLDIKGEKAFEAHYIDRLLGLLRNGHLEVSKPEYQIVQNIARLWTLTTLRLVGEDCKARVLQSLYRYRLIDKHTCIIDLQGVDLGRVNLGEADLREASLRRVKLQGADLQRTKLGGADLREADLRQAHLQGADLQGADLREADLREADLRQAHLQGADLQGADLQGVSSHGVDLQEANLQNTDLRKTVLRGVNLKGANLQGADLTDADLGAADLSAADLSTAKLIRANLRGSNLQEAKLLRADLSKANLKNATGLLIKELEEKVLSIWSTTMPDGQVHP